jgi:hypothetical protein
MCGNALDFGVVEDFGESRKWLLLEKYDGGERMKGDKSAGTSRLGWRGWRGLESCKPLAWPEMMAMQQFVSLSVRRLLCC